VVLNCPTGPAAFFFLSLGPTPPTNEPGRTPLDLGAGVGAEDPGGLIPKTGPLAAVLAAARAALLFLLRVPGFTLGLAPAALASPFAIESFVLITLSPYAQAVDTLKRTVIISSSSVPVFSSLAIK
jgi:hypothetical protein